MKIAKPDGRSIYDISSKISRCGKETEDGCGCDQPSRYKVDGIKGITAIWKEGPKVVAEKRFYAEYVKTLFEKTFDEDVVLLGFSTAWCRPEWLIVQRYQYLLQQSDPRSSKAVIRRGWMTI